MKVSTIKSILVLLCIKGCLSSFDAPKVIPTTAESKLDTKSDTKVSKKAVKEEMSSESYSSSSAKEEVEDESEYRHPDNEILSDSRKMAEILSTQKLTSLLEDINEISSDDDTALEVDENDLRFLGSEMPQWQESIWDSQISTMDWTKSGIDKGPLPYEIEGLPWYRDGKDLFRQSTAPHPLDVECVLYNEL